MWRLNSDGSYSSSSSSAAATAAGAGGGKEPERKKRRGGGGEDQPAPKELIFQHVGHRRGVSGSASFIEHVITTLSILTLQPSCTAVSEAYLDSHSLKPLHTYRNIYIIPHPIIL